MTLTKRFLVSAVVVIAMLMSVTALLGNTSDKQSDGSAVATASADYLNPGAPMSPTANEDWFDILAREGISVSRDEMSGELKYGVLLRAADSGSGSLDMIVPVPQCLQDGTTVMGYTLRYTDRIALVITPTDFPMDVEAEVLERTIDPDVNGVTHPWHKTSVRGVSAIARNATVQKWESGDFMDVPAVLEWLEPCDGEAEYIRYALVGDVSPGELKALAAELIEFEPKGHVQD